MLSMNRVLVSDSTNNMDLVFLICSFPYPVFVCLYISYIVPICPSYQVARVVCISYTILTYPIHQGNTCLQISYATHNNACLPTQTCRMVYLDTKSIYMDSHFVLSCEALYASMMYILCSLFRKSIFMGNCGVISCVFPVYYLVNSYGTIVLYELNVYAVNYHVL